MAKEKYITEEVDYDPFAKKEPQYQTEEVDFDPFAIKQEEKKKAAKVEPYVPLKTEERPQDQSVLRQVADVPLKLGAGLVTGVRMVADAMGADSGISKSLRGVEDYIADLYSAQSKQDSKEIARIMKDAEDKGVGEQVLAGVKAFSVAPVDILVNALGTSAPAIAGALLTTLAAAPAAVATAAGLGIGAIMGAGTIKGSVYDATKQVLSEKTKLSPQEIEARAVKAQEYGGENLDSILIGAGLGAFGASSGIEPVIARQLAKSITARAVATDAEKAAAQAATAAAVKASTREATEKAAERGVYKNAAITGVKEFAGEGLEGGQEQMAQNYAQRREGFDVPVYQGVVSQATMEGLAGLGMGSVGGYKEASSAQRELMREKVEKEGPDKTTKNVMTTTGLTGEKITPNATADDINTLVPATNKAGQSLTDAAPETVNAKQQADDTATKEAEKAKISLDEATTKANELIAKVDGGGKSKQSEIRQTAAGLGVKIPFGTSNADALEIIRQHIQGAQGATGSQQQSTGAGANVVTQPSANAPAGGTTAAQPSGVAATNAAAAQPAGGKAAQPASLTKTAAQQDEDLLKGLFGDDGLPSVGSARRTKAQMEMDAKLDQLGRKYGLNRSADETPKDFGARIKEAIDFEKMREGQPLSALSDQDIAKQTLREDASYIPPDLQIEAYEKARQKHNESIERDPETGELMDEELPAYKELSPDDRRVYFQEGLKRPGAGTEQEHAAAVRKLADYRSGVKEEAEPYQMKNKAGELLFNPDGTPMMAQTTLPGESQARDSYNRERDAFGRKTGLSYAFPAWNTLSQESKRAYIAINKTDTALEQDMAFRAVKRQLQAEKVETAAGEKTEAEQSRVTNRIRDIIEKSRLRKEDRLPDHVLESLFKGDIKAVLKYISEEGNGVKLKKAADFFMSGTRRTKSGTILPVFKKATIKIRDSISMGVFRSLASTLADIDGLKVNVVFDENMIYDQLARYDAKTNTIYVGPNGLNEATILHELVHAATVKIIHQFYTDASKLTPRARQAVEQLIAIAAEAKKRLGSRFPNAFDNLYEFVSYSQTDIDFQEALHREQVGKLATTTNKTEEQSQELQLQRESTKGAALYDGLVDTLWNAYTGTLAYLYKVFTPNAKNTKIVLPTEKTGFARKRTAAEIEEGIALEKAARGERRQTREMSEAEKEALAPEKLFDNPDEEMDEASIPPAPQDLVTQYGVSNLQRAILREPGYKGNLLLEAAEMFQLILAAPEGGIAQLAGKQGIGSELAATKPTPTPSTPAEKKTREGGIYDKDLRQSYKLSKLEKFGSTAKAFLKRITTAQGWRTTAKEYIDRTYAVRYRERQLSMAGLIERDPTKAFNNVAELMTLASGTARNYLIQYLDKPMMDLRSSIAELAKLTKKNIEDDILPTLHMLGEAFGEPEKRHMKWVLSVPLSTTKNLMHNGKAISAAQRRIDLVGDPRTGKAGIVQKIKLTPAQQKQVRAELEALAKNHADALGDSPRIKNDKIRERALTKRQKKNQLGVMDINEDSDTYNVLGINKQEVDLRMEQFNAMSAEEKALINKIMDNIRTITAETAELNKIGNYWSYPVSNIVGIYDYQNYMPFKGLAKHSVVDELIDPESGRTKTSRLLQQEEHAAHGRFSVSDNPILQTMSDAYRAAGRAGRRDFMQAILNAVKPDKKKNPNGTGIIDGEVVERIEFPERETKDLSKYQGKSYIFVYGPDGSLSIVKINEKEILEALRYQYQENGFMLDMASKLTNTVGSFHTRWNINFAAKNFVSDTLQNAWKIGTGITGPLSSLKYLVDTAGTTIVKNGLGKAMQVAILYEKGDEVSNRMLRDLIEKDEFVRDMVELLKIGGKTAYLQSYSLKSSLQQLEKELTTNGVAKTLEAAEKIADVWGAMFEFTSRTAAYQLFKREYLKKEIEKGTSNDRNGREMSPAEQAAAVRAAADTKNLTNFEVVGSKSKYMSALYMFYRASASSALSTMEGTAPAFRRMAWAESQLPANIRNNQVALDNWRKEYAVLQRNSQIMIGGLIGFGYCLYLMSMMLAPDDEWKRNTTKYDNMEQWTRYARFHLPESVLGALGLRKDTVLQIPWGFGLGSFASMGAQIAGMVHGQTSFKDGAANIVAGSLADAFLPLPISKIPFSEKPGLAGFDTIMPSILRPYFEYLVNTDGVGRGINSTMNRRLGDAYTGSDRVPEVYKDVADYAFRISNGEWSWSPNTLYFFANSYIDGIARFGELGYSLTKVDTGAKNFNPKTDLPLFGSFFGAKANVDAKEYGNMESRIKELDKQLYTLEQKYPERVPRFESQYPFARPVIEMYKQRQGELNKLRHEATVIRTDRYLSPKDKESRLKIVTFEENLIKHAMVQDFKAYGMKN